jgi:hypothetical protein
VEARGQSDFLGPRLDVDPAPVFVHVKLGIQRYCMTFGGETTFVRSRSSGRKTRPSPRAAAIPSIGQAIACPACGANASTRREGQSPRGVRR